MSEDMIFVFGSNEAGIHGAGAAKYALQNKGARLKQGWGLQGKSFGIPTKDKNIQTLPIDKVQFFVEQFIVFANKNPELEFQITRIGCGLAGFKDEEIAPLFLGASYNCQFDYKWKKYFDSEQFFPKYWGTH